MGFPFDGLKSLVQSAAATVAQLVGQAISVASIVASGNGTFGSVTVTTPGDITLGVSSDLNLGNNANSQIRGGNVSLRMDDTLGGCQVTSGSNALIVTATDNTLQAIGGTNVLTGDTTSPAKAVLRVTPQDAEPTGPNVVGDMYVTTAGVLNICTVAGTPGTWTVVGTQT